MPKCWPLCRESGRGDMCLPPRKRETDWNRRLGSFVGDFTRDANTRFPVAPIDYTQTDRIQGPRAGKG